MPGGVAQGRARHHRDPDRGRRRADRQRTRARRHRANRDPGAGPGVADPVDRGRRPGRQRQHDLVLVELGQRRRRRPVERGPARRRRHAEVGAQEVAAPGQGLAPGLRVLGLGPAQPVGDRRVADHGLDRDQEAELGDGQATDVDHVVLGRRVAQGRLVGAAPVLLERGVGGEHAEPEVDRRDRAPPPGVGVDRRHRPAVRRVGRRPPGRPPPPRPRARSSRPRRRRRSSTGRGGPGRARPRPARRRSGPWRASARPRRGGRRRPRRGRRSGRARAAGGPRIATPSGVRVHRSGNAPAPGATGTRASRSQPPAATRTPELVEQRGPAGAVGRRRARPADRRGRRRRP